MTWPLNTTLLCTFGKESTCNAGNPGSIPGLGRYPGEGLGYPLQYSDLENSMDYTVHGVENSWTQLSNFHFFYYVLLIFRVHVNVWQKTTKLCKAIILQLKKINLKNSSVQSLSCVQVFAIPWTAAGQASMSITSSQTLPKLMSIESVMPSNHLILCHPLLLPPSIFPGIMVFSSESVLRIRWPKYWFQLQHQSFQWSLRTDLL